MSDDAEGKAEVAAGHGKKKGKRSVSFDDVVLDELPPRIAIPPSDDSGGAVIGSGDRSDSSRARHSSSGDGGLVSPTTEAMDAGGIRHRGSFATARPLHRTGSRKRLAGMDLWAGGAAASPSRRRSATVGGFELQTITALAERRTSSRHLGEDYGAHHVTTRSRRASMTEEEAEEELRRTEAETAGQEIEMLSLRDDHTPPHRFMLRPYSWTRDSWDVLIAISVVWLSWVLPYSFAFPTDILKQTWWKALAWTLEAMFWLDIIINFNTGYVEHGIIIMDPKKVRMHYLHGWFFLDLLGSIPFEYFLPVESSGRKAVKLTKGLKMIKLLRVARIVKYLKMLRVHRTVRYMRSYYKLHDTLTLALGFIFFTHWAACLWFGISSEVAPEAFEGMTVGNMYFLSLSRACLLLLGVDGPDFLADDATLYIVQTVLALLGFFATAALFASVNNMLQTEPSPREQFRMKVDAIRQEMHSLDLPHHLQERIKLYYDYLWLHGKRLDGHHLVNDRDLSSALRREVALHLAGDMIPFKLFEGVHEDCLSSIVARFRTHIFIPGDIVAEKGEIGREMFFVGHGKLELFDPDDEDVPHVHYTEGDIIGEIALLTRCRRTRSIRALQLTELMVLSREDLFEVLSDYPDYHERLLDTAAQHAAGMLGVTPPKPDDLPASDDEGDEDDSDEEGPSFRASGLRDIATACLSMEAEHGRSLVHTALAPVTMETLDQRMQSLEDEVSLLVKAVGASLMQQADEVEEHEAARSRVSAAISAAADSVDAS
eukprot:PLAT6039.1.p1 GENE.PLAT6039.1~~PLAT6039.1.p1  ORF type:complete len:770 (+),score=330.40 PLAT6039.1:32-2341(+)